jgi:hypothetical protein
MTAHSSIHIQEEIPKEAVFVVGAGQFGSRAARVISERSDSPVFVVDLNEHRLSKLEGLPVKRIPCEGTHFLVKNFHLLHPANTIVPAIPAHLACEWLKGYLKGAYEIKTIEVPEGMKSSLPYTWPGSEGSLLLSYADFMCPDDCTEPEFCTVTGESRDQPLHDLLSHLDILGFGIHVIRSRQIGPGLGGYRVADLTKAAENIAKGEMGKWLLGTACRCHGIVTAFTIQPAGQE